MNNNLSQKQRIFMIGMFILGTSSLLVMGLEAKKDIWISIILALFIALAVVLMYGWIFNLDPNKDFFEIVESYLGKFISKIFFILIGWFCFQLSYIVLRNYGQFIVTIGLPETPIIIAMISLTLTCILAIKIGIIAIGRWAQIFIIFIFTFIFMGFICLTRYMDFNNLKPMLYNGFRPVLTGTFGILTFPFCETVAFLLIFPAFKKENSSYKVFSLGLLCGGILIFLTYVSDILVLGVDLVSSYYYPSYSSFSRISLGNFFQRLEIIAATIFVIAVFLKTSILMLAACKSFSKVLGVSNYRILVFPICLMILNFAYFSFDNITDFHEWTVKFYPTYSSFFEIIIPLILFIILKIRKFTGHTKQLPK